MAARDCANGGGVAGRALRALTGVATVVAIVAIVAVVALAATLFRGGFTDSVPVTVMSPQAGLVMNPDAKVQIRGVQVGKIASIEQLPNGEASGACGYNKQLNIQLPFTLTTVA